jgi:hypothetical protein
MRFVETKTPEQQSCLMLHRTRHLFIRKTGVINAIRAHLAESGVVAPVERNGVEALLEVIADANDKRVPEVARACLAALGAQLRRCKEQILEFDRMIMAWHRCSETSKRLDAIPGVGRGRALQETRRACGMNGIASDIRRDVKVGRANSSHVPVHRRMRAFDRDLIRGSTERYSGVKRA